MKYLCWLNPLRNRLTGRTPHRPIRRACRLRLEVLEDRAVPSSSPALPTGYGNLPLGFEANQGQTAAQVDFLAHGKGYTLGLTSSDAVLALKQGTNSDLLDLQLVGANKSAKVVGQDELITKSNYLIGSDPSQWHTGIANYGRVEYQNVYSGINLVYYGNQGQLEYDFVAAPGADTGSIHLSFKGAKSIALDAQGNLVLHTSGGDVVEHAPVIYQEINGVRQAVTGRYVLEGDNQVGFQVDAYDHSRALTIDPVLSYSTYLGGSSNEVAWAIAVDASGNAYVTGKTASANFPTTANALQSSLGTTSNKAFVSKLNSTGTALLYSTYLGGNGGDEGYGIAVDSAGDAYVTGVTSSANFPTTAGAFQQAYNNFSLGMAFVTELNPTGSGLLYSSYLGSTGSGAIVDWGYGIALDASGNAYVAGRTNSTDFITTSGAFSPTPASPGTDDAFVTKIDPSKMGMAGLVYSTYLGGSAGVEGADGIAVDTAGNAYVTGYTQSVDFPTTPGALQTLRAGAQETFITKLNAAGSALVYSTYLGGSGSSSNDSGNAIALDAFGNAYVTGSTNAANFPTTVGAFQTVKSSALQGPDAFVAKLNTAGSALVYSTYLGGSGEDYGRGIAVDSSGKAYVTGETNSSNFPILNAVQPTSGGSHDAFVTKLNASGSALAYSTYLGGSGEDYSSGIAIDAAGNAYIAGYTASTNFPTTPGAFQGTNHAPATYSNAFIAKISSSQSPSYVVSGYPTSTTAGAAGAFTVTAKDGNGNPLTGYTGTVHFTSSDPLAVLPADYTFTTADQGAHTFTATLKTAGTQSITATDITTATMTGTEAGITVNSAAASSLTAAGFPSSITAGVAGNITVTLKDPYGNVATGYTGTVHFTSSDPLAVLPANYTFTAADKGVHTFTATLKKAGSQSITATDISTASITGSQTGITVNPAAASKFLISAPASVTAGVAFSLTLTVQDAYGNVVTGYAGTVHFKSSDGTATLPANYTFTAADQGVHTFTGLVLRKKGTQTITITDTLNSSLTGSVSESVV